jgi:hypothetical protein
VGLGNRLIIPLNPPLKKGDLKTSFPNLLLVRIYLKPWTGFVIGSKVLISFLSTKN